ncbi:unnamed protein product, partial [Urochloa humidicola]
PHRPLLSIPPPSPPRLPAQNTHGIPSSPRALPHSLSSLASRTLVLRIPAAAADLLPTRQRRISTPPSDPMAASSRLDGRLVTAVLKQDRAWRVRAGRRRDCIARPGHQQAANDIEDSNAARICSPLLADPPSIVLPHPVAVSLGALCVLEQWRDYSPMAMSLLPSTALGS